jgi:hypothetical protein
MSSNNTIRICAAGSGKTWGICNDALSSVTPVAQNKRVLITTYTNKGVDTINSELAKQNIGVISNLITVRSWYQFLMSEFIRPYQSFIGGINEVKSFDFSGRYGQVNYGRKGERKRYFSGQHYIKKDNASELVVYLNEQSDGAVINRLERIYSHIYIDEIQDMAGEDLSIVQLLFASTISVICVGDNKQATYQTHNTRKGKRQSGRNFWEFCMQAKKLGMAIIEESMVSRRFNGNICAFANYVFPNSKNISTCMAEISGHDGVFIIAKSDVKLYCEYFLPDVLKYDKRTDVGDFISLNFGQCKGMTFDRVLVYPNKPLSDFLRGKKLESPEKYYVAVTRPKYSLAILVEKPIKNPVFEDVQIKIGDVSIQAQRFIEKSFKNV